MYTMLVGAVIGSLEYIDQHAGIIEDLAEKSKYFRDKIQHLGFTILNSSTHIVPLLTGDSENTIAFSRALLKRNVFAPPVRWPAVPKELGRIRFSVTAAHTYEQIDRVLEAVEDAGREIDIRSIAAPSKT
jgi:7-keto-8-aminopelargonate synthetase-like enzyme